MIKYAHDESALDLLLELLIDIFLELEEEQSDEY